MNLKELTLPTYQVDNDWNVCVIPWAKHSDDTYEAWFTVRLFNANKDYGKGSYWLEWNATLGRLAKGKEIIRAMHKQAPIDKVSRLLMDRLYFGNKSSPDSD